MWAGGTTLLWIMSLSRYDRNIPVGVKDFLTLGLSPREDNVIMYVPTD